MIELKTLGGGRAHDCYWRIEYLRNICNGTKVTQRICKICTHRARSNHGNTPAACRSDASLCNGISKDILGANNSRILST